MTRAAFPLSLYFLTTLAAACGGGGGGSRRDGGRDLSSSDGGVPPGADITGTRIDTYITESSEAPRPVDLSAAMLKAVIPNTDGTFRTFSGTGRADGTFTIPDVPAEPAYVALGISYVLTGVRTLDFGRPVMGRPDRVANSSTGTTLVFNVTGLNPWQTTDELQFFSVDADAFYFSLQAGTNPPAAGATRLTNLTVQALTSAYGLIDGSKGDRAHLTQLITHTSPRGVEYTALGKSCTPAPFTQASGQRSDVACALQDVAQTRGISLLLRLCTRCTLAVLFT